MNKLETAKRLAKAHAAVEPYLKYVFLLEPINEADPNDPIKLLEVVEGTIERGIEPIAFCADPDHGLHYPSVIVEVSPREFDDLRGNGNLTTSMQKRGWSLGLDLLAS